MDSFKDVTLLPEEYSEVMKRAARFCMASRLDVKYAWDGCQIDEAYSSLGRTNVSQVFLFLWPRI